MWFVVARVLFCGLCTWRARQEYVVKKLPLRMGTFKRWWLCCWILMFATLFLNWASILWGTMEDVKRSVWHLSVSELWGTYEVFYFQCLTISIVMWSKFLCLPFNNTILLSRYNNTKYAISILFQSKRLWWLVDV